MRIDSPAYQPERGVLGSPWTGGVCRRIPALFKPRIPPIDRVRCDELVGWRWPYLPASEPYWLSLKRENAWRPGVFPLPYWAVLEYSRRQQEEADRLAAHTVPATNAPHRSRRAERADGVRSDRLSDISAAPCASRAPEPGRLSAPRIGDIPDAAMRGPRLGALRAYAGPEPRPATGRFLDVLG